MCGVDVIRPLTRQCGIYENLHRFYSAYYMSTSVSVFPFFLSFCFYMFLHFVLTLSSYLCFCFMQSLSVSISISMFIFIYVSLDAYSPSSPVHFTVYICLSLCFSVSYSSDCAVDADAADAVRVWVS